MLKQRVITAFCLLLLILVVFYFADQGSLYIFLPILLGVAAWEWAKLSNLQNSLARAAYAGVAIAICCLAVYFLSGLIESQPNVQLKYNVFSFEPSFHFAGILWAVIFLWLLSFPASSVVWGNQLVSLLLGFCILVPFVLSLLALSAESKGLTMIFYVVCLVAAADSGAYFVGKAIGKTKLAEKVSPNKTWEGFAGGLAAALLLAAVVWFFIESFGFSLAAFLLIAFICACVGVLGDLFESMLKRHRGVKDSGSILPGHGGVLDRIDSHMAALPIFAMCYAIYFSM